MTFNQAADVAQRCADETGVAQAIGHDRDGEFYVFTCPSYISAELDAVIDPTSAVSTNHA